MIENSEFYKGIFEEQQFRKDLIAGVNQAVGSRRNVSELSAAENEDYGIYESTDPRSQRVVSYGNRVVVKDVSDYSLLLDESLKRVYKPEEARNLKSRILIKARNFSLTQSPAIEKQYLIEFFEGENNALIFNDASIGIFKNLPIPEDIKNHKFDPKREVNFVSQNDPKYRYVVEEGIVNDLESSNLCWLAATENALSVFIKDSDMRDNIMRKFVKRIKVSGEFNNSGKINSRKFPILVEDLNLALEDSNIPVKASLHSDVVFSDFINLQKDGSVLLFGTSTSQGSSHLMAMTEILKVDNERVFFQVYDSGAPDEIAGSKATDNFSLYRGNELGIYRISPFIISINSL